MADSVTSEPGRERPPRGGLAGFLFAGKARGLAVVAALLFCAAISALWGAYSARCGSNAVKEKYLPLMETALVFEGRVYEAMYYAGIFGSTGDIASYSGSRIRFAGIREASGQLQTLAAAADGGAEMRERLEKLEDLTRRLDLAVEKQRTLIDALGSEREKLRKTADDIGEILLGLQARIASETPAATEEKELDAKARLLALGGFALAVEAVTNQASSGLTKSAADLAVAEGVFGKRWHEAETACRDAGPDVFARMRGFVAAYRETASLLRFNLEEVERLAATREEITAALATETRGLVSSVRNAMSAAVKNADAALFTALLFGGLFLALAVIMGAGLVFGRRSRPFLP